MRRRSLLRIALLACALLSPLRPALAGTYLVCLPSPDVAKRTVRFCPGRAGASASEPCECLLRTSSLPGTMTLVTLADTVATGAQTMCVPPARPDFPLTLCPAYRVTDGMGCSCVADAGGQEGETYTVDLMPRIPLRTNQAAAADFLRRLQECCSTKQ